MLGSFRYVSGPALGPVWVPIHVPLWLFTDTNKRLNSFLVSPDPCACLSMTCFRNVGGLFPKRSGSVYMFHYCYVTDKREGSFLDDPDPYTCSTLTLLKISAWVSSGTVLVRIYVQPWLCYRYAREYFQGRSRPWTCSTMTIVQINAWVVSGTVRVPKYVPVCLCYKWVSG